MRVPKQSKEKKLAVGEIGFSLSVSTYLCGSRGIYSEAREKITYLQHT